MGNPYDARVSKREIPMYSDLFDPDARRKTVSLTINADLLEKVKAAGINASRTAEAALIKALEDCRREQLRAEIAQDFRALDAYIEKHGDPSAELREMFGGFDAT
jgi:antitoxin CcdA